MNAKLCFIDTHTHLEHDYGCSTSDYIQQAHAVGVKKFITIGTRAESFNQLKDFAENYPDVFFTVGIHPHEAIDYNASVAQHITSLAQHPKCLAIGEIGLDYFYNHSPQATQRQVFQDQIALAIAGNKPIVVHARDAEADLISGLLAYKTQYDAAQKTHPIGIIHCFSGTQNFAEISLKLGFYLSFSGIVTFKKADDIRAVVAQTPLDKILLETDAPFLAPMPYRGKQNQSAFLIETAKMVASIKNISLEELANITFANSQQAFNCKF